MSTTKDSVNNAQCKLSDIQTQLAPLRCEIDAVDDALLALLQKRCQLSLEVGHLKKSSSSPKVFHPQRELDIVQRLGQANVASALPSAHIARIWGEIFSSSRALQEAPKVAYLGPEGTYSHKALLECLGQSVEAIACPNLDSVFRRVHDGQCALALVPLENSLQGSVGQSCDLFLEYSVHIEAEHYSRVSHCLLACPGQKIEDIGKVYSHPQALAQCQVWLGQNLPLAQVEPMASTAAAAQRAQQEAGSAALGQEGLAGTYSLVTLAKHVEDQPNNWTRFVLLAPGPAPKAAEQNSASKQKTSLLFTAPEKAGGLAHVLGILAQGQVNLCKLESRPLKNAKQGENWHYVFFADTESCLSAKTYQELKDACHVLQVLGSYPAGSTS